MTALRSLGVLGAGAWGTALAQTARRAGREVVLWARDADQAARIAADRENPRYLPGVRLDPELLVTADLGAAAACDALLLVVPAQHLRATAGRLALHLGRPRALVICAKGIEQTTGLLMTDVLGEVLPAARAAVLSGPTFAAEVARGLPTAVTLACADAVEGAALVRALGSRTFRPYLSDDPIGAQVGGAVKNVVAIACGIVAGRGLGENARAALITRALAEIVRLGEALGARRETLTGLSGLGDLALSCTSARSRNFALGQALGAGQTLEALLGAQQGVVEGVHSAAAVVSLAARHGVEMPICAAVDAILNRGAAIDAAVGALLARPFKAETL